LTTTSTSITTTIDSTLPIISNLTLNPTTARPNAVIKISANVHDENLNTAQVGVTRPDQSTESLKMNCSGNLCNAEYRNTTKTGKYALNITANDTFGNTASETAAFTVANTRRETTIITTIPTTTIIEITITGEETTTSIPTTIETTIPTTTAITSTTPPTVTTTAKLTYSKETKNRGPSGITGRAISATSGGRIFGLGFAVLFFITAVIFYKKSRK